MSYEKFNLEILEDLTSTNYGDYGGLVQVDKSDLYDFWDLCESKGISMRKYFLIGLHFGSSSIQNIRGENSIYCFALLLDKEKYGTSFDEISKSLDKNENYAEVKSVNFKVTFSELAKCIKRFNIGFVSPLSSYIKSSDIKEEL